MSVEERELENGGDTETEKCSLMHCQTEQNEIASAPNYPPTHTSTMIKAHKHVQPIFQLSLVPTVIELISVSGFSQEV